MNMMVSVADSGVSLVSRNLYPWHRDIILIIFFSCDHTKVDPKVRVYCSKVNNVWWHLLTAKVIATNLCQAQKMERLMTTKTGPILLAFTQLPRQKIMSDSGLPVILLFSPLRTEWLCVLVKKL